ncbi:sulfite exporter TauE/SafE family protein [Synoicihabitans lomoniglobus]|uniref:Probable membrane transporter protein n=1 Tax=Synoicihabitans lomoniglobus TaxID=2909285 RepID=A0AAF0CMM0_9BACT|nr:sulfite exporter TauE/SafE family protein [Opitutaceae bacterium LMO-M01]WED63230.1 sulfite exporter TauE/SafE family protein [Opitutaceae bacterium LMO-M01]
MNLDFWQWVLVVAAAMFIGVSKTAIGGLGMVSVTIFANIIPAREASGFVLPLLICGDLVAVKSYRAHTQWRHLLRLFPWAAGGVVLGWIAMGRIDDRQASLLIGLIVIVMIGIHLWRRRKSGQEEKLGYAFAATIGVLAGFTTLIANAAGPLMAIYLLAMRLPKMEFMGTGAVFFFLINLFKVPFMMNLGLINGGSFTGNLVLAPAVFIGALIGRKLLTKIDQRLFENLALGMSAIAGLKLLF